ncbi:fimbrial protein [Paraburkholderia caballeronis]|uniref:fimbrial protein n=1 Tax=Paraburkholderia caballeronis TaxID=416943 RepID=UPI0010D30901|nr:fimbrial protein [Paraburkholderia caballeronis]TDV11795.1 type 1 fimbria pilin [Paraburkholderia caballeronis]TDV14876.1 type 1 fimbria pilin [Paraburkholderia caballeronis]TDV23996.1 type 1 fimbria pilin [Paraburkholderia caballeronis]
MKKFLFALLLSLLAVSGAHAACSFKSGSAVNTSISLPSTLNVLSDTPNGTILWSRDWLSSGSYNINCSGSGVVAGTLASGIGTSVDGFTNAKGYDSVFATNVPGIGISVYWCNTAVASCNRNYADVTPIPSLPASWGTISGSSYNSPTSWSVQLVKTGAISPGPLSAGGVSTISYMGLVIATLMITGGTPVATLGCQINPTNITVALPTVMKHDFTDSSPTPTGTSKATPFNISLACDAGVQVLYKIDGTQTGSDTNVLANSTGSGMAQGIGVQLLQGDPGSNSPVPIGQSVTYGSRTAGSGPMNIPLVATYYKTVPIANVVPGIVSVTATFTVLYQ